MALRPSGSLRERTGCSDFFDPEDSADPDLETYSEPDAPFKLEDTLDSKSVSVHSSLDCEQ